MSFKHHIRTFFILMATLALLSACATSKPEPTVTVGVDPVMGTLVTTEWLSQHLDDPDLVVLDCYVHIEFDETGGLVTQSGRAHYDKGHIPSAGFADLVNDLSDGDNPLQYSLPSPEQFSSAMGALGVGNNTRVVLYDGYNSAWAARVWWMLRWIGFDRVAILDGGLKAWVADGLPLSTEPASRPAQELTPIPRPQLIADRDEVLAAINNDDVSLIDAMPSSHYRGEMVFYERSGHIPGASNIPASELVDESGHYRPVDELAALFGDDHKTRAITYCGGGIAASSDAFIMTRLGFTDVAVYIASLQEWAADFDNPMETETP